MNFIGSPGIDVKRNIHLLKTFFDHGMIFIHDLLRTYVFFQCPDGNGHSMFVAAANEFNISILHPLVPHINISR